MPVRVAPEEMDQIEKLVVNRKKVPKGKALFRNGDAFGSLYAVRVGYFKTRITTADGQEQVTGFQMPGELLGFDGIFSGHYMCEAVALDDAEVCIIPFDELETLSRQVSSLQQHLHRVMSREIVRDQNIMLMLGRMRAEERIAAFLLNLAHRLKARGQSQTEFILRMSREEIGSYLGLTIETVSRTLTKLAQEGVISVNMRAVTIRELGKLQHLVSAEHA